MKTIIIVGFISLCVTQIACFRKAPPPAEPNVSTGMVASVEANRAEARTLLERGREQYRNDEDTQAVETFQQALKLDPEFAEAHFRLGLTYDALGQEQEAEGAYKKAVETYKKYLSTDGNEDDAEAHYNLGQSYNGLHLYTEAVREYRQAIKFKPDDPAIHYDLGLSLMRLAQYDQAAAAFSKSLELDPQNYRAEDSLAEAKEGVTRIRTGKRHQEELLKKKKLNEKEQDEEGGETPAPKNANTRKPV